MKLMYFEPLPPRATHTRGLASYHVPQDGQRPDRAKRPSLFDRLLRLGGAGAGRR